jgi:MOSC domain-containing protein YiiM/GNAT superfamily N-acetyltransferase
MYAAAGRRVLGDTQTAWSPDELRAMFADPDKVRRGMAAVEDGVVVGAVTLVLPQHDNPRLAYVALAVHPDHWRRGIGTQLLLEAERSAARDGRSVLVAETQWPADGRDESGKGFAARFGYAAAQTVLRSSLALPADRARLEAVLAAHADDGYALETCVDGIPDAWLEGRAELSRRMSTDAPRGEVELEEEVWDAARVRREYDRIRRTGRRVVETFAVERATGHLVGYTQVQVPLDRPDVCYQQDTLVLREHRGHRLGIRMKAANALALEREAPGARFVRTWNAEHNEPMLAVNRELGWVADARLREWQKVLPVVSAIHVAPATKLPTRSVESVEAEAGRGLVGDRYHGSRHRHVTVQSLVDLEAASADLGAPVPPGQTRRNITLSSGPVPTKPGTRIRIGTVDLEVVRVAAPCRLMDEVIAPGAREALHQRAGSVFRLLGSGTIRVGDVVELAPDGPGPG